MTPGARVAAAIEVLDRIIAGAAAEQALTGWARASRYAGSKDRAAVRDYVFTVLRRWRSCAALGGGETGRALMLGALRQEGAELQTLFSGVGHAPAPLSAEEKDGGQPAAGAAALDLPDWVHAQLQAERGAAQAAEIAAHLRDRAPLHLRVNLRRGTRDSAASALAQEGIETRPVALSPTALEVTAGTRRLRQSTSYTSGLVEIQDAASQAVCDEIALTDGLSVLDYCAGGGGKSLALAARCDLRSYAHDGLPERMKDLAPRADRAGVRIQKVHGQTLAAAAPFDVVVADVPCSGSGAWRRQPEAKWRLTEARLTELVALQAQILAECSNLVAPGGRLVLITCSILRAENEHNALQFLSQFQEFEAGLQRSFLPMEGGDGLFVAQFARKG